MKLNYICCLVLALAVALLTSCAQHKADTSTTAASTYDAKSGPASTTTGTTGPRGGR